MRHEILAGIFFFVYGFSGCGGGVEGTGADLTTLNPGVKINDLSKAQIDAGCDTLRRQAFDGFVGPGRCSYLALTESAFWYRYRDGDFVDLPLDYSTAESAAAICEAGKINCAQNYSDVTFDDFCENETSGGSCILEDKDFRARCNVEVGMLFQCVQETLAYSEATNAASHCRDTLEYRISVGDTDPMDGSDPNNQPAFDKFPPYNTPTCDKISAQCGFAIIDFGKCNPRFV